METALLQARRTQGKSYSARLSGVQAGERRKTEDNCRVWTDRHSTASLSMSNLATYSSWLNSLDNLPTDWALICCDGHKRPWDPTTGRSLKNWPEHEGLTVEEVQEYEPQAVGVLLGEKSGGLLAIDFDGPGSEEKFLETFGRPSDELPKTIAWTSGKTSRKQLAFVVDRDYWPFLKPKSYAGMDKNTVLEIRWNGQQSVIAGAHPETEGYQWMEGCSPQEVPDPAEAPYWLLETLIQAETATRAKEQRSKDATNAQKALKNLDPSKCTAYKPWLKIGMCLHSVSEDLLEAWICFSSKMDNFDREECKEKWNTFTAERGLTVASLVYMAEQYGYEKDKEKPSNGIVPKGSRGENVGKVEWMIEGFLAKGGTTLLAAEAGSGKTSFLMRAGAAVEEGELFLDQVPTKKGRVLFIQGDEPKGQSEAKMHLMGLKDDITGTPFDIHYLETALDYDLFEEQSRNYDLIIIDSATSVIAKEGGEVEDAEFSRLLYKINSAVSKNGCSCIITTHLRKSADGFKRQDITAQDIAGRTTIANAITDFFGLMKVAKDEQKWDDHFALKCLGKRYCRSGEVWQLQGNPESFWWGLNDVTDGMPPRERKNLEEKVLGWFDEHSEPVTLKELSAMTGTNEEYLRRVCTGLFQCKKLERKSVPTKGRPTFEYFLK